MASGAGEVTFARVGGHLALDLLNTVDWRLAPERRREQLTSYAHVLTWAVQLSVVTPSEQAQLARAAASHPQQAADELEAFRELRETAYAAIVEQSEAAAARLVARGRTALARTGLTRAGIRWVWREAALDLSTPGDRVVREILALLTDDELARLRQCADDACGWVFLDTSPRHNRLWCVASECGNRNRARRHYARKTQPAAG